MNTETASMPVPSTRRRRLGDGMLTPVAPLEFKNPRNGGRVERLLPGRDRVSTAWFGHKLHPELFRVVNRDDTRTVARHRQILKGLQRRLERETTGTNRATTSRPRKFSLGLDRPREVFRLP